LPWGPVVNTTGIYKDTLHYVITNCDSVIRIVNLTVQAAPTTNSSSTICSGQSYNLPWGPVVNTTGIYTDTIRYVATGCDSLIRIVNLTVQTLTTTTTNPTICQGQTYVLPWGTVVSNPGTYRDTLRHVITNCDSVYRIVNLAVQNLTTVTTNPIICQGQTYTLPSGTVVSVSGTYRDTLRYSITNCDSIRRIVNLVVQAANTATTNPIICSGQSYTLPWGTVASSAGTYRDTLHYSITNCDSVYRVVNLTVQTFTTTTTNAIICQGQTYTLPWGTVVSAPGIYRDTLHHVITNCDSVYRIVNLAVQNFTTFTTNAAICSGQSYTLPWGTVVNTTGVYRDTLHYSITNCDSLRRIVNLVVQAANTATSNPIICSGQSYTLPWGTAVSAAGIYKDTLHYSITNCDSLYRIVNLSMQTSATAITNPVICSGQSYVLPWGIIVNSSGIYRDTLHHVVTNCDSVYRIVNLTVQSLTTSNANATICQGQSYTLPWGAIVNTTGIYRDTLHHVITNCDSVYRIVNLYVTPATVVNSSPSICSGDIYTLPWGAVATSAGIYTDTIRNSFGCDSIIRKVNLTVRPKPNISLTKSNDINCILGISKLSANGGTSYLWSPTVGLDNPTISNPVASPGSTIYYHVKVTSANGCFATDSIQVLVDPNGTNDGFLLPSAFTPNGDGKNDCFGLKTWGQVSNLNFSIYNRWGEMVFHTEDPSKCWDGSYKGVQQPIAVYVYQITAETNCGKVYRKGIVTLLR